MGWWIREVTRFSPGGICRFVFAKLVSVSIRVLTGLGKASSCSSFEHREGEFRFGLLIKKVLLPICLGPCICIRVCCSVLSCSFVSLLG